MDKETKESRGRVLEEQLRQVNPEKEAAALQKYGGLARWCVNRFLKKNPPHRNGDCEREDLYSICQWQIIRAIRTHDPEKAKATTWIAKMCYQAIRQYYQVKERAYTARGIEIPTKDPHREAAELSEETEALLKELTTREREVVVKTILEGKKLREVAEDLQVSKQRVQQIQAAAIKRMAAKRFPGRLKTKRTKGNWRKHKRRKRTEIINMVVPRDCWVMGTVYGDE